MAKKKTEKKNDIGLESSLLALEKAYGKGILMKLSDSPIFGDYDIIPSGNIEINKALGIGGYPKGRIIEIYGVESSGKTTLALHAIAECQKEGGVCAFVDAEHALDPVYAGNLGVNVDELWISQPDYGEQALEVVESLVRSGNIDLIVLDSVASLTPRAEIEGNMGDSVTFDTPVYIRNKMDKSIDIIPISDLHLKDSSIPENRNSYRYKKHKSIEILTHEGWKDIKGVVVKKNVNNKEVKVLHTVNGYVKATEDHCFFQNGEEKSIKELNKFDRVDIYTKTIENSKINSFITPEISWLLGFWVAEGSTLRTHNYNRFEICNSKREIIERCKEIVDRNFLLKSEIRERENDSKRDLNILSCSASKNLGYLIQQCMCKNSKLKKIPKIILNSSSDIKEEFLKGFFEGDGSHNSQKNIEHYYNNSLPVIAGLQYLLSSLTKTTSISINKNRLEQLILRVVNSERTKKENEILSIEKFNIPELLYDISTDSGTFITAVGNIVIHNSHMGLQARLMSQALRKLTGIVSNSNTCVIFINQIRMKIGVMFGNPETTTGGKALKFYSTIRIEMRRIESIKRKDEIVGNKVRVKVVKNKVAPPFKQAIVEIMFGEGISNVASLIDLGVEYKVIEKSGSWYSYGESKIGQGKENVKEFLGENPEIYKEIESKLKELFILENKKIQEKRKVR